MDVPILKEHPEIDSGEGRNSQSGPEVETDLHQGEKMSSENSDYDSADSYSDDPNVKIRSRASDEHSNSDAGSVTLEREEGDGQESVPSKKVDDDEDKKNPQYIPKRGTFYEHDDRTAEDDESNVIVEEDKDKDGKKKVWQDKKERWAHDRFSEQEQGPKTRTELIGIYGYDIRNEDGPPRARRRRRYGRGPNKYTRNWEDEDAYNKPQPVVHRPKKTTRPGKESEEFPPLVRESTSEPSAETESNENREQAEQVRKTEERTEPPKEQPVPQPQIPNERVQPVTNNAQEQQSNKNSQQRIGSGRVIKPTAINGFTSRTADIRKYNVKQEQVKILPNQNQAKGDFIQSQNFTNKKNLQDLEREMNKLSVDGVYKGSGNTKKQNDYFRHGSAPPSGFSQRQSAVNSNQRQGSSSPGGNQRQGSAPPNVNQRQTAAPPNANNQRQGSVPPRLQSEQKGSKRYSSMRQRSLPEANNPPLQPNYHNPPSFYPNDYSQQSPPVAAVTQPLIQQPAQIIPATTTQVPQMATLQPIPQQVPVPNAFPHAYPPPPPTFLQSGYAAPTYLTPQVPQGLSYVQGQAAYTPNYQSYPPQQFNPATPPTELYQPQGGITYYSTDQQLAQRQAPQKRPKAAIPIVAPPGQEKKTDDTNYQQNETVEARETNESVEAQQ
ncbi:CASC3 exon junction complex subunit isoform X2 [Leptinotarsa decemlineata]|uniref:CASC3 exon junction complex subunit isoform X2 n=1 Tax=Leptinotarsa decemlineata TaxID=7539 RepID=UPI003D30AD23